MRNIFQITGGDFIAESAKDEWKNHTPSGVSLAFLQAMKAVALDGGAICNDFNSNVLTKNLAKKYGLL